MKDYRYTIDSESGQIIRASKPAGLFREVFYQNYPAVKAICYDALIALKAVKVIIKAVRT